ncbi:glycosyltransferase [Mesorhizobium sp. B2-3-13]|uniref:glycosyltransferase n=1 Tax=Mesorhizobium sp. B2-3-13 TaxID=2589951 RepID=UPI00112DD3B9|nr:glycosyltransferase [Mesorhizobium sp. B2-3-13]TPL73974.1 glycosyltransferase [Mesorhizobium sp. B2-3-13]
MNKHPSPENLQGAMLDPQPAEGRPAKARTKAKPAAAKGPTMKRTCIMVLGMHRSGTSALTRAISLLGAELPKNMLGANPTNPTGHWEPLRLMELHDRMLAEAGSSWDDWRPFEQTDLGAARLRFYKSEIARLIDEEYGAASLFILKEPRISRLVPLYAEILKRINVEVRYVLTQRNPLAVIASLEKRDGFTSGFSALLWLRHELEAEHDTRGKPRVFVSYEALLKDWRVDLQKIAEALHIEWPQSISGLQTALSTHFSTDHQHHAASADLLDADPRIADWVKQAYGALRALEKDPTDATAMARLDTVRISFDTVSPVFGEAFFDEMGSRVQRLKQASSQAQHLADERAAENDQYTVELASVRREIELKDEQLIRQQEALRRLAEERTDDTYRYTTELEKLRVKTARKDAELAGARNALAEIERERQRATESESRERHLTQELEALHNRHASVSLERDQALGELQSVRDRLDAVYGSTSWRLTSQLRSTTRLVKRVSFGFGYPFSVFWNAATKLSLTPMRDVRAAGIIRRSGAFDRDWYLKNNPDVAEWRIDPLRHYVVFGAREGRDPNSRFSSSNYLLRNPDVALAGVNPFAHFLAHGRNEGREGEGRELSSPKQSFTPPRQRLSPLSVLKLTPDALRFSGGVAPLVATSWRVLRREGTRGIGYRIRILMQRKGREEHVEQCFDVNPPHDQALLQRSKVVRRHVASVDIIICVHNALDDVRKCLESVTARTMPPYNLIIVDDGSDELTASYLREFMIGQPGQLLRHQTALGYTRAANAGLRASTGDFTVLLNSDTIVTSFWLDRLVECAQSDDKIGIVGPLSNTASWQSVPLTMEDGDWALNSLPEGMDVNSMAMRVAECSPRAYPKVGFLNGFCILLRRSLIEDIGYFDEVAFGDGYGEENDYCLRASGAGWLLAVAEDTYVYHAQSKSYSNERRRKLVERSDQMLREKHDSRILLSLDATRGNLGLAAMRARISVGPERILDRDQIRNRHEGRRVLFLLPVRDSGGGANVVLTEAQCMMRAGVDVTIANLRMHKDAFELSYPSVEVPIIYLESPQSLSKVRGNFDAIIATVFFTVEWLRGMELKERQCFGYYVQDFEPYFFDESDPLHAQALSSYTAIPNMKLFTKTAWNAKELKRCTGIDPSIVGPSYDCDRFFPSARGDIGVIRIAAMIRPSTPRRAPELTASVLERICRNEPKRVEVHVFGCSPEDPLVRRFVQLPNAVIRGHLNPDEMSALLASVDIFADFSVYQAMGLTALEAMGCATAVVGPANGGLGEIVTDHRNGLIVDTTDENACYDALVELVSDNELLRKIQLGGLEIAAGYYSEGAAVRILDALFPENGLSQ